MGARRAISPRLPWPWFRARRLDRTLLALAAIATRRIAALSRRLSQHEQDHSLTLTEVDQLQTQNAMLDIIARSVDVPLAFQALAARVARLVPCDRVGLALLSEDGQEFQTYTARVQHEERRSRPRPEIVFKVERTILGGVVRSREPMIIDDIKEALPTSSTRTSCSRRASSRRS